jgi:ABC-2 type transport system permease protein
MRKVWVIAVREYNAAVRTKAFIISLVIMPVLMGGGILMTHLLKDFRDTKEKRFAVLDRSKDGRYYKAIKEEVDRYNQRAVDPRTNRQLFPPIRLERAEVVNDTPEATDDQRVALSNQVRDGKLTGFIDIGPDVAEAAPPAEEASPGGPTEPDYRHIFRYQTNRSTVREFAEKARQAVTNVVREERALKETVDIARVKKVVAPVTMNELGLSRRDPRDPTKVLDSRGEWINSIAVPLVFMILMFMMVMMCATPMMQGVVEEKMQRIAEVLLGSVQPFKLMLGKLIGMTGVSLTIAAVYLGGIYAAVSWASAEFGLDVSIPLSLLGWFVLFQALAGLMYGSLFIAIGAACTDMRETQNLIWPVMLLATLPMFVLGTVLQEPNSPVVVGMSFFPFATPMLMTARVAIPPGIPLWQPLLGTALGLATTLLCVWAAGRIFRVGLLMQGKGARLGEMMRWVFRG